MSQLLCIAFVCMAVVQVVNARFGYSATIRVPADHRTIQAAIDAAAPDDVVLVGPGTYHERIRLTESITVISVGDDSKGRIGLQRAEVTIIDGGGADKQGAREQGAGVTMAAGSILDGFTVTNVGLYDDAVWNEHHATQGEHQAHEHIGAPGTPGIGATGVTCTIRHNIVHKIGYTGIAIQGADAQNCSPHVYRNVCYRNMGGGIGSMSRSTALIEENVCFQNFYAGIGHDDASPTVIKNVCYENIRAGIGISEGACPIVRRNRCYENRRAGIGTRTGAETRPIIEDNDCYDNEMAGIGSEEGAAPLIRGNRCYRNKLAGIGSRDHAAPMIIGNECHENQLTGIGQESDAVTVLVDNHCHHNNTAGIGFAACNSGRSTLINNRVIDNAKVAIGIQSGWTVHLSGNEVSREGGLPPIVMVFEGATATLTDNLIRGGGVAGVRVAGTIRAENNEFAGTSMRKVGPPNFAIWALPGSTVTMTSNEVHGWRHALLATEATISASKNRVSNFHRAALVIEKPIRPADVVDNVAVSSDPQDEVVSLNGESGVVRDNKRLDE